MTSSPRKILPTYIQSTSGNSNISYYQARAAAQVYSTARSVLPSWTTNYFRPDPHTPSSPTSPNNQDSPAALLPAASLVDHSLQDRFVAFDVLRGRDVLVKAKDCGFSIFNVGDRAAELEELCGYSYFDEVIYVKIIPNLDSEAPPKAAILTKTEHFEITLSIVSLSTSLAADHSVVLPKNIITTSLITSQHYIAIATPKTITVYSPTLSVIATLSTPIPTVTGSARWLIYPTLRPNTQLPRSQILDTPPETRLVERVARGLTKEVVSWGRETGEKIGEALYSYLNGPNATSPPTPEKVVSTGGGGSTSRTTLVVHDIPTNTVLTQFQVPIKVGFISVSKSGTMLFCSSPKGDEFFVYSLNHIPTAVHLVATFSRGYTYSRVINVIWRGDNGCMGVISARGTGHVFSLKRRGKETARAVGKVKIEGGGVKGMMFVRRGGSQVRRRSSTTKDEVVDVLTVATTHERVTSWKLSPAQRSTIGLLTSYFNPPTTEEPQSIPVATAIADYTLPPEHRDIPFSFFISSPVLNAAFTNQRDSGIDCAAKAEVECSLSTRGVTGIRGIRLFEYTFTTSTPDTDFGGPLPWTQKEIDLGMPRGEVRYFGIGTDSGSSNSPRSLETPPSSEQDSPDLQPETGGKKKRRNRAAAAATTTPATKDAGIERAISASLGTELDKTRMTTVPPTPPGSFSTPKVQPSEWMGDILDRGKTIVRNVRRRSSTVRGGVVRGDEDVCFEDGVEVLSLEDAPTIALDGNESADSDGSSHQGKVRGEASVVGGEMMDQWDM